MYLVVLIKGLLIGLVASMPLGPIGILCVKRTLRRGKWAGFVSGLGAASVDTIFALIATFGFSVLIRFIEERMSLIQLIAGTIVTLIGLKIFIKPPRKEINDNAQSSLFKDFLTSFVFTLYNPLTVFVFMGVFASFGLTGNDVFFHLALGGAVFCGASLWWLILVSLVSRYHRGISLRSIMLMNKIAGVLLMLFGLYYMGSGLWNLFLTA